MIFICFSCASEYVADNTALPLFKTLNEDVVSYQEKIDFNYRLIELETSDSVLIDIPTIMDVNDSCILLKSENCIYFFNLEDGAFMSKLDGKGNGPYEYNSISDAKLSRKDKSLYICDIRMGKVIRYSGSLKPLGEIKMIRYHPLV